MSPVTGPQKKTDGNRFVQMQFLAQRVIAGKRILIGSHLRPGTLPQHGTFRRIARSKTHQHVAGEQNDE